MKFGVFGLNVGPISTRDAIVRFAETAESVGFESIWTGEHVVVVDPQVAPSPVPPQTRMVDTIATLAFAAAVTDRVKLASGVLLLAQRNPVVVGKELAGIDVLSDGRLIVGVGVGYIEREFEVIGVPYAERGARVTEHIEAMRALWTQDDPAFEGQFTRIAGVQSHPHPIQRPHPPILVGGMSGAARRRAVRQGDGWYGFGLDLEQTEAQLRGLEEAAAEVERPAELGPLETTVTPPPFVDLDTVRGYEALGVSRLVLQRGFGKAAERGGRDSVEERLDFIVQTADALNIA